jgi:hypothetical protein
MTDHDATAAIVAQLAEQRERLGRLDAREQASSQALAQRLAEIEGLVKNAVRDSAPLATRLHAVEGLAADLARKIADVIPDDGPARAYKPSPTPQLWRLGDDARDRLVRKLSAWVQQVYRPVYGHLAARLPACWPEHDLAIALLDCLSELHLYYHLNKRTPGVLAAQGEFNARLLPALADLLAAECARCGHDVPVPLHRGRPA